MKKNVNSTRYRFLSLIHECEVHVKRILKAQAKAGTLFPITPASYSALSDDAVTHIDQLVYRFTKLQNTLGAKFFPLIVSVLREDSKIYTIYDVLNELEKYEIIPSVESWMLLREIRNQIAHDYENDPETGSHTLNEIFSKIPEIVHITEQVISFTRNHIISSLPDAT